MSTSVIPRNFQEWQHCITVECGIQLTPNYIDQRISALQQDNDEHTRHFVRLYGEEYRKQVIGWFKEAQTLLASAS